MNFLKYTIILFLLISTSNCAPSFYTQKEIDSLGEFNQFFPVKRGMFGTDNVKIIAENAVSISFNYSIDWVNIDQLNKAAQYHCQKHSKNALQKQNEKISVDQNNIVFECK